MNSREVARVGSRVLLDTSVHGVSPLLSIAIPTFKRFDLLAETLESVFSLRFNFPVEVLVVDNDPENDVVALKEVAGFRQNSFIYYKNIENVGMFGNWNQCLRLARGKYITVLHDDDLLLPAFASELNARLSQLEGNSNLIFAFQVAILDQRENRPCTLPEGRMADAKSAVAIDREELTTIRPKGTREFFFANPFCGTLGIVMDRTVALELGGFDASWFPIADYEFWCRWVISVGKIPIASQKVGLYRMRQNESMVPQTRRAFVTKSRELRAKMITEGVVPIFYSYLLPALSRVQKLMIDRDWRVEGDRSAPADSFAVFVWRCLVFSLTRLVSHR